VQPALAERLIAFHKLERSRWLKGTMTNNKHKRLFLCGHNPEILGAPFIVFTVKAIRNKVHFKMKYNMCARVSMYVKFIGGYL
jgi:hypothetical protein